MSEVLEMGEVSTALHHSPPPVFVSQRAMEAMVLPLASLVAIVAVNFTECMLECNS